MRNFDFDGGTFFMCTEISPRCFTIQQVNDVDMALQEVAINRGLSQMHRRKCFSPPPSMAPPSAPKMPIPRPLSARAAVEGRQSRACHSPLPILPWWFTAECRQKLMEVPPPPVDERAVTPDTRPPSSIEAQPISQEQLRQRIQRQLEYYFSRENLVNDRYLRCQMDADQYVPIKTVANFPKVTQLSTDLGLIVDVLKSSSQVQVDESGQKVRPLSKRCTIILREIPEDADENEVKAMFGDECPHYQTLSYGLNNSWYVTFATEQDTQKAFFHLQTLGKTFNGCPVFARIKTGGAPFGADMHGGSCQQQLAQGNTQIQLNGGALRGQLIVHYLNPMTDRSTPSPSNSRENDNAGGDAKHGFDLGNLLTQCGYSPRATFRPLAPSPTRLQPTAVPQPSSFFTQPILHNVGHNEFVLRQCAKEDSRSWDPGKLAAAMLPSPVPRITDVPRLNGMGGSNSARFGVAEESGDKHCPTPTGGAFMGFQRQESVEAYQIAMAANGVAKQRRATLEIEEEEEMDGDEWEAVSNRKTRRRPAEKYQNRQQQHNNASSLSAARSGAGQQQSERQFSRIFGARSVDSVQPRPLANYQNCREICLSGPMNKITKYSSKSPDQSSISEFGKILWNNDSHSTGKWPTTTQQFAQKTTTSRVVQPLLSLTSANFAPLNCSAFQQLRGTCCNGTCASGRLTAVEMEWRGGGGRGRTWTSDWGGGEWGRRPKLTAPKMGPPQQPQQQSIAAEVNGLGVQQQETDPATTKRTKRPAGERGGSGRAAEGMAGERGGSGRATEGMAGERSGRAVEGMAGERGGSGRATEGMAGERSGRAAEGMAGERGGSGRAAEGMAGRVKTAVEPKRLLPHNSQCPSTDGSASTQQQQQQFRRRSREQTEKDAKVQRRSPRGEAPNGTGNEEGQQQKQINASVWYNFEEREFPALLSCASASSDVGLSDHSQPKDKMSGDLIDPPALSSAVSQRAPCAFLDHVASSTAVQLLQFSAVVAGGHGRRRATIGTTAESGRRLPGGREAARAEEDGTNRVEPNETQQRSGTIGAADRSYAQMLKGWSK